MNIDALHQIDSEFPLSIFDIIAIFLMVYILIILLNSRNGSYKTNKVIKLVLEFLSDSHDYYPKHLDGIDKDFNF